MLHSVRAAVLRVACLGLVSANKSVLGYFGLSGKSLGALIA